MNGRALSEQFFTEVLYPVLQAEFAAVLPEISAALLGEGSEVLGFDDALSEDHNFCPRVVVLVADERFAAAGSALEQRLRAAAPPAYRGYRLLDGAFCRSITVAPLEGFILGYLGVEALPEANRAWLGLDEQKLVELTRGAIFHDPRGTLRAALARLAYYPEGVRTLLLYQGFMRLSEAGAIERALRREDWIAVDLYRTWLIYFSIRVLHVLQRRYCPYRKWMGRSLEDLGMAGAGLQARAQALARAASLAEIRTAVMDLLVFMGESTLADLGMPAPSWTVASDLHLTPYNWDSVLGPLAQRIPPDLDLSPLISPPAFWGLLFDYTGLGGDYATLLQANSRQRQAT